MSDTAESLAADVIEGRYSPSTLDSCEPDLPVDRNPQVIRYRSFFLFADPNPLPTGVNEPGYLILAQYRLRNPGPNPEKPITEQLIRPLSRSLAQELIAVTDEDGAPVPPDRLPNPDDARTDVDRLRLIALERRVPNYRPELPDTEVRTLYKGWFQDQIADVVRERVAERFEVLERAGFDLDEEIGADPTNAKSLADVLSRVMAKVLLPSPYQPFRNPHPHFALCATFEQVWEPKGYTRGELINTIGLAPGEQLTLEVHSWDKSTFKSESELATESEMRVSENINERDVRTIARQVSSGFNVGATIPVKGVPVNVGGTLNNNVNDTLEQTRERTVEASNTVKNNRKLRIEVAREVGREQKQTRVISNTNRCHAVNCHYFEVMSNYVVTTRLVTLTPCVLLHNPKFKVTPAWVLCHQDVLIAALLDKTFLPGLDAARMLETQAKYVALAQQEEREQGDIKDPVEQELKTHVDAILGAYQKLKKPASSVKKASRSTECQAAKKFGGKMGWALCVATKVSMTTLRRMLYFALLYGNRAAINALEKLENEKSLAPSIALQNFFAAATPRDFQYADPASANMANGLDAIGVPEKLVDAFLKWGILAYVDFATDDAGLYNDVKAASAKLKTLMTPPSGTEAAVVKEGGHTKMEIAQAQAVFGQLACHLEKNWVHYTQAILTQQDADQRFLNLQGYGAVASIIDNDLLGFFGHKAAYPIKNLEAVKSWLDFEQILRQVEPATPAPQLVTLPTQGTVLEAIVAECDACEDFIRQSRVLDLRTQEAKSKQEEAEADRRERRLTANDLTEFGQGLGGDINITVNKPAEPPE
jgi:hypothetical protein